MTTLRSLFSGRLELLTWVLVLTLCPAIAAEDLRPEVLTLSRIKAHARQNLSEVHNYTCAEFIHRFHKPSGAKAHLRPLDIVRLEVAHIEDRELYSTPGDRSFREGAPSEFTGGGMMGNGAFALYLRALFVDDRGTFTYRGNEVLNGRAAIRYDFRIPLLVSGYSISVPDARATVGTRGSFWVDRNSLDLLRLDMHADEIPPAFPVAAVSTTIDYARVRIGDSNLLLPQTAQMHLAEVSGIESRNDIDFSQCRSFSAQSTLSFESGPPAVDSKSVDIREEARTPAGLLIPIVMTSAITERMSVGESLQGRVAGNIVYKGAILIPDGSPVRGRVRRLERHSDAGDYFIVALEFTEIDVAPARLLLEAELKDVDRTPGVEWLVGTSSLRSLELMNHARVEISTTEQIRIPQIPGVGSFFVTGQSFTLPIGFRMLWKTIKK